MGGAPIRSVEFAITATLPVPARSWNSLADLDELVLACESPVSAEYLDEAVACYRGGAYRAAIVATWVAVTYDYLDKLNQLDIAGDKEARKQLEEWEQARSDPDWKASQRLEQSLLDVARDAFEFLSEIEYQDLVRLRDDRHRCAHPSHDHAGEPYQPTAEQARAHLRTAVEHLLSRPPVQGKAALARLTAEVDSAYFPSEVDDATDLLGRGPLGHARDVLVRNATVLLLKEALNNEGGTDPQRANRRVALAALHRMHTGDVEAALYEKASGVVSRLADGDWGRAFDLFAAVPAVWDVLDDPVREKARRVIEDATRDDYLDLLSSAMAIDELESSVVDRAARARASSLAALIGTRPVRGLTDEVIRRLETSESFYDTKALDSALEAALPAMDRDQVERTVGAFLSNDQFYRCGMCAPMMDSVMARAAEIGEMEDVLVPVVDRYLDRGYTEGVERYRGLYPEAVAVAEAARADARAETLTNGQDHA